ncbi:MAG: hypothetical protein R3224_04395 [Balneolaceae bacterium]|nr:hypothetical protein [Balneolaceae bacterium]
MDLTAFDGDEILTDILTDYLDGELDRAERTAFQEYLRENEKEREFARKARQGKHALNMLAGMLKVGEERTGRLTVRFSKENR